MRNEIQRVRISWLAVVLSFAGLISLGSLAGPAVAEARANAAAEQASLTGEDRIARQVRHELLTLPFYSVFDNLAYSVDGYTVTLYGQVVRPTLKSDSANVVKRIEGVENVVNNIEVLPLSPMDDRIRLKEYRSIYGFPSLNRYSLQAVPPIHIIVKKGDVTLVGVVATQADKNIAGLRANAVSGVFSVINDLRVEK